jgi:tight adherence protein C
VSFDGALCEYVERSESELSRAFAGVLAEMSAGVPRIKALTDMAKRFDVPEAKTFIRALVRSDQERISLVETLRNQAGQLRRKLQTEQ